MLIVLNITLTIDVPATNSTAPMIYGIITFLYSAFCSTLPVMYLIPIISTTAIATTIPTTWIMFIIFPPIFVTFVVSPAFAPSISPIVLSMSGAAKTTPAIEVTG